MYRHNTSLLHAASVTFLILALTSISALSQSPTNRVTPRALYLQNQWLPIAVPDSHGGPGSVFSLTDGDGLRYVGSLSDCGFPLTALPYPPGKDPTTELTFASSIPYSPRAVLSLSGVTPGPGFSKIASVSLLQEVHGAMFVDLFRLRSWIEDFQNLGNMSAGCRKLLNMPHVYIVEQSYGVSKGKFILKDHNGDVIDLRTASPPPLTIAARSDVKIARDGGLQFDQQIYTAVRHLSAARRGAQTLGSSVSGPPPADPRVSNAMIASDRILVEPSVVYNAVFAPTVAHSKTDIVDATPASVSFFIGPPDSNNAIDATSWTVAPKLLEDKTNVPLIVRMTCTFCKDEVVQKQAITYFGSMASSSPAVFKFLPQKSKIADPDGIGQIDFQITQNNIQVDYIVVRVHVVAAGTTTLQLGTKADPPAVASLQTPVWARAIDLILSIRSGAGDRLEVSFQPGTPELNALFQGKQNSPDGSVRWFKTGVHANQIPRLEGDLYLDLFATINGDVNLKTILSGSTVVGNQGVSAEQLTPTDQKKLVKLLATHGATWYKQLFVTGAETDLTTLMAKFRTYSLTDRTVRLRIESQGIYLPWQLIIPPSDSDWNAEEFWGFRYEVSVDPTGIDLPSLYLGPLQMGGYVLYGQYRSADPNDDVANLGGKELTFLQTTLGLSNVMSANSRDTFKNGLANDREDIRLILTFTHGANGTNIDSGGEITYDSAGPRLIFAENEYLPVSAISQLVSETRPEEVSFFSAGPVIFLNGCETGTAGFYTTTNEDFAGTFLTLGSRGVVVTEAPIWIHFGYDFGQSLLQELKTGEPITDAILKTRKAYLRTANNPLGLLYSYYGGADVAIRF